MVMAAAVLVGCSPRTTGTAPSSMEGSAPAAGSERSLTPTGWHLTPASLGIATIRDRVENRVRFLDTLPGSLLLQTSDDDDNDMIFSIDRRDGRIGWKRRDVRDCFFERADRIWCTPADTEAGSVADTGRVILDRDGETMSRLDRGRSTTIRSALARQRGDITEPPTVSSTVNAEGLYGSSAAFSWEVRSRETGRIIAREEVEHPDNRWFAGATSYLAGFATSINQRDTSRATTVLHDNSGRVLGAVGGMSPSSAGPTARTCLLPVLDTPTGWALIDPHSGRVLYSSRRTLFGPSCGTDYLVTGSVFVDADGRARELPIEAHKWEQWQVGVIANTRIIAIREPGRIRFLRRSDLRQFGQHPLPTGATPLYADENAILMLSRDGVESISLRTSP